MLLIERFPLGSESCLLLQLLGWGSLVAAAGIGYYFARQDINERRRQQQTAGTRSTEKLDCKSKAKFCVVSD